MVSTLDKTINDIKSLKIQGASKVRKEAIKALKASVKETKAKTVKDFKKEFQKNSLKLVLSRPTEPELRTAIRIILKVANKETKNLDELKDLIFEAINSYEENRKQAMKDIALFGANKIPKKTVVFTHCHSHTVEEIIKLAWKKKKVRRVICTETRPLYQGHITADALSKAGIPVTMIVDSAAARFMKEADIFLSGADAVLEDGSVVNKIGTKLISMAAEKENVPHYVATSSHKFDPITFFGVEEPIEERSYKEVWEKKPGKVKISNPAFDVTNSDYIAGIITEKGVFEPKNFALEMYRELELDKNRKEFMSLIKLLK